MNHDGRKAPPVPELFALHSSWITVDPIVGCPANCAYCYLGPLDLTGRSPVLRTSDFRTLYRDLATSRIFNKRSAGGHDGIALPIIAIGNYTDMGLTPQNRAYLLQLLEVHREQLPEHPVCILTKAALDSDFIKQIAQTGLRIILLVSLAFLDGTVEPGAPPWPRRLSNFAAASEYPNITAMHWWRPITKLTVSSIPDVKEQLRIIRSAGAKASIAFGLSVSDRLTHHIRANPTTLNAVLDNDAEGRTSGRIEQRWAMDAIIQCGAELAYPVFRDTSCALSWALGIDCYNCRHHQFFHGRGCVHNPSAPEERRVRCAATRDNRLRDEDACIAFVSHYLSIPQSHIVYDKIRDAIVVNDTLPQDTQTLLIQLLQMPILARRVLPTIEFCGSWRTT